MESLTYKQMVELVNEETKELKGKLREFTANIKVTLEKTKGKKSIWESVDIKKVNGVISEALEELKETIEYINRMQEFPTAYIMDDEGIDLSLKPLKAGANIVIADECHCEDCECKDTPLFEKYDNIYLIDEHQGYQCICADDDTAVFARISFHKDGENFTDYADMFAYSNKEEINTLEELNVVNYKEDIDALIGRL